MSEQLRGSRGQDLSALLICELANPEWTSVPLEGWSHAQAIAMLTRAHRITQIRNRGAFLRAGVSEKEFTAIDSEAVARNVRKAGDFLRGGDNQGWTTLQALAPIAYAWFEHLAWRQFGERIKHGEYDIVHRITPLSPTTPSSLARRCAKAGVPFILGPLNGGVPWPSAFDRERRNEREWLSYIREGYRLLPGYASTRHHAAAIICGSLDTLNQMPRWCRDRCIYIPENAIDPLRFARAEAIIAARAPTSPLRIAFVGRLVPYKGADMLLEAAAPLIRAGAVMLDIIGDGPLMPLLRNIAQREGLEQGVSLPGWIEHKDLQERLGQAHIFAFPSIREFGGAVVLEAMALGIIPIVVDYGGPGELVTDETGFRLPLTDRAQLVEAFRKRLTELAHEASTPAGADALHQMGLMARQRVLTHYTWDAKARQVLEVYRWVRGERDKPSFDHLIDGTRVIGPLHPARIAEPSVPPAVEQPADRPTAPRSHKPVRQFQ